MQDRQRSFAALPDGEQLRQIEGQRFERSFAFERATVDEASRTVWMSIASEREYERWWGIEILEVTRQAIRAERLEAGAPILVDHSARDHVGVIEGWEIKDKKLRVHARFGASVRAQEIWQDVLDGIRRNTSVGYMIHKALLVEKSEEVNKYRVTDWEPLEGSLVAVPADPSVGPGRALEAPQAGSIAMTTEAEAAARAAATAADPHNLSSGLQAGQDAARADERKRVAKRNGEIIALGELWPEYNGRELALAALSKPDITVEMFRTEMLAELAKKHRPLETGRLEADRQPGTGGSGGMPYGMEAREMLAATSLRAFKGIGAVMGKPDHEVAYRAGMWAMAVIHGNPRAIRWCQDAGVHLAQGSREQLGFNERTMLEGVFTSAGWLVPMEMEAAIISNREEYGVARRICNVIPMGTGNTSIPRITSDATAYFVGEDTAGTPSDPGGDQVNLTLKDLMTWTNIGKSTAMDTVISLAELVAREQARAFAVKEDSCLIIGDGTSTFGGIRGLKTLLDDAAYAGGRVQAAAGHDTFAEIDVADVTSTIGILPVYARAGTRWLCSGVFEALVFGRLKLNAGGNTVQTVQGRIVEGDYAGFPISVAHHMLAGAGTVYNAVSILLLGNFNLGVAFGSGTGMMMTVDPYTEAHKNLTRIITTERLDIVAHGANKSATVAGPIVALHGRT
jgi:HK97 family phage major capsid protein